MNEKQAKIVEEARERMVHEYAPQWAKMAAERFVGSVESGRWEENLAMLGRLEEDAEAKPGHRLINEAEAELCWLSEYKAAQ